MAPSIASRAPIVSTDLPTEKHGYVATIPCKSATRCNPVNAPPTCDVGSFGV